MVWAYINDPGVPRYDGFAGYMSKYETTNAQYAQYLDFANPFSFSSHPYTNPVGYYPAYGYSLCDMAGNVWEWTASIHSGSIRVVRGGSWYDDVTWCTVSVPSADSPILTYPSHGFRVCR